MKKPLAKLLVLMAAVIGLSSCTYTYVYTPQWWYNCYPVYDWWGYYMYDECYWEYYNADGTTDKELDMVSEVADTEKLILDKTASVYAEKFSLSMDNAMKIAKNVQDFSALEDRSASDIADFAQKLYGVNPSEMIEAVSKAQIGNNAELEKVINQAAENFNTSESTMREIVKELHGQALESSGIRF